MPNYDYICQLCGHSMEAFHSMSAPALTDCPECHQSGLKRKIGVGAGILFKGSGFYETDYKRKPNEEKKDDSKKEGTNKDKGSSTTDKKPKSETAS